MAGPYAFILALSHQPVATPGLAFPSTRGFFLGQKITSSPSFPDFRAVRAQVYRRIAGGENSLKCQAKPDSVCAIQLLTYR